MQEEHRFAVGAKPGLPVAEDARAAGAQAIAGGDDVTDLVADMVDAAGRVLFEKPAHRRGAAHI